MEDALMPAVIWAVVAAGVALYYPHAKEMQERQRADAARHMRTDAVTPGGNPPLPH